MHSFCKFIFFGKNKVMFSEVQWDYGACPLALGQCGQRAVGSMFTKLFT